MLARNRRLAVAPILILLLAFGLRMLGLTAQGYWYDEGFSISLAQQGWRQIILGELNLPPLYNLSLGAWLRLAGTSELAGRHLSVCAGLLIVALGGVLAKLLLGRRAGLLAMLLLAVSPIEVWYAQEARMYALLGALSLASSVILVRLLRGARGRRWWVLYALVNVAAAYTHYYAALVLVAQAVWVALYWLRARDWPFLRAWLAAHVGLGLALLPWLPVFLTQWQAAGTTYWPGSVTWQTVTQSTLLGFAGGSLTVGRDTAMRLALATGLIASIGLVAGLWCRRTRPGTLLLVVYLVVPFALFYALVANRPKLSPRYLLVAEPALLSLAAGGLASLLPQAAKRRRDVARAALAGIVAAGMAGGLVFSTTNPLRDSLYGRDDLRGAAAYLTQTVGDDEAVLLLSGHMAPAFALYYHRPNCYPIPPDYAPSPAVDDVLTLDVLPDLDQALAGRSGVWVVLWQDDVVDPNGLVLAALDQVGEPQPVAQQFRGLKLRHYTLPPGTQLQRESFEPTMVGAAIGQGDITLVSCSLPSEPVPAGSRVSVLLNWRTERPTSADYRFNLQVLDEYGQVLAAGDGRLAGWMYPSSRWPVGRLISGYHDVGLPAALPPGEYTLRARIFVPGDETAQLIPLGSLQVSRAEHPPELSELQIAQPLQAPLGEMEIVGCEISPVEATPGQTVYLTVYWRALARPGTLYDAAIFLGEKPWTTLPLPASTTEMQPGDIYRVQYPLSLPRDAENGEQTVSVTLRDPAGAYVAPPVGLAGLTIRADERYFSVPANIGHPLRYSLGEGIALLGYDLSSDTLWPGETFHLTLYWQAVQPMETSYTVFAHLLDGQEKIWGQTDTMPRGGSRPTSGWLPGEVLVDTYDVTVRGGAPAGQYVIEIGMYNGETGERLAVLDEEGTRAYNDRILLAAMEIK